MSVTVVTPSLPERAALLAEACASVAVQTRPPDVHLVGIDHARRGPEAVRNALVGAADTEWVAFLDDDDLLDPRHIATLLEGSDRHAAVVYSWCRVTGRGDWTPNEAWNPTKLRSYNYIPVTAMVRRSVFVEAGGFPPSPEGVEDWLLWRRILDMGGTFHCVPIVTWTYRFNTAGRTLGRSA